MSFSAEGGTQTLTFTNNNIVPFTFESSQDWCRVTTSSTNEANIPDGIAVTVDATTSNKEETAIVTLTTLYGKEKEITVTRAATGTIIQPDGSFEIPAFSAINNEPRMLYFSSNSEQSELTVSANESWCHVTLSDLSASEIQNARQVQYIGKKKVASYQASNGHYYQLQVSVDDNATETGREAEITLKSKDGNASYTIPVLQNGLTLSLQKTELQVGASAQTSRIEILGDVPTNQLQVSSNATWCKASVIDATTNPEQNLGERRYLLCEIEANVSEDTRTAVLTLKMKNGKNVQTVNVKQNGYSFSLQNSEIQIGASAQEKRIEIIGDVPSNLLQVSSNASWCKPSIIDATTNPQDNLGNRRYLLCSIEANIIDEQRTAVVTLKMKNGKNVQELNVSQAGRTLTISESKISFDRNSNYTTVTVTANYSGWKPVSSDDSWCKISWTNNTLTIRVDPTTVNREATISFEGHKAKITVKQNRYTVGDSFEEGKLSGTVGYISYDKCLIYKSVGNLQWSTETVPTGATSMSNGQANMDIIKKIPDFEKYYPAFAACDALNVDGVTGWYIPAYTELLLFRPNDYIYYWSSTEKDTNYSYGGGYYNERRNNIYYYYSQKNRNCTTLAIHLFE